jgi:hypothetical protein
MSWILHAPGRFSKNRKGFMHIHSPTKLELFTKGFIYCLNITCDSKNLFFLCWVVFLFWGVFRGGRTVVRALHCQVSILQLEPHPKPFLCWLFVWASMDWSPPICASPTGVWDHTQSLAEIGSSKLSARLHLNCNPPVSASWVMTLQAWVVALYVV